MTPSMFESIYKAYFGRVYHYLLARCRDHHLAEELTAETFFRALRGLEDFRGDCDPGTWLCRIAGNLYASHLRKQPGPQPLEEALDLPDPAAPAPAEQAYKEVFLLRALGELSFRQIGSLFGKTENWACVTYHRARKKLQKEDDI